jgi:hypothetical protein
MAGLLGCIKLLGEAADVKVIISSTSLIGAHVALGYV